jgi:hypothetical protein
MFIGVSVVTFGLAEQIIKYLENIFSYNLAGYIYFIIILIMLIIITIINDKIGNKIAITMGLCGWIGVFILLYRFYHR